MSEYIEREAALSVIRKLNTPAKSPAQKYMLRTASVYIQEIPAADVAPVVYGRWERCGGDLHSSGYAIFCSACNKVHFVHRKYSLGGLTDEELFKKPKYCPSCGAVMECEE